MCIRDSRYAYEAAQDLGATPAKAFVKVVLPDILPGILSGFLMAFTMSLDDFIITHFTRGAGINTLSTLIYSEVRRGIQPSMYALSTVIFVTVLALLLISNFAPENQAGVPAGKVEETMKKLSLIHILWCALQIRRTKSLPYPPPAAEW